MSTHMMDMVRMTPDGDLTLPETVKARLKNVARKTIVGIGRVARGMVPRPEEVFCLLLRGCVADWKCEVGCYSEGDQDGRDDNASSG